jgi:hypothetical protein
VQRLHRLAAVLFLLACDAAVADACPVCQSETGEQVRAGIVGADFGPNLLVSLLPFLMVLGLAAALHCGFTPKERAPDAMPPGSSTEAH